MDIDGDVEKVECLERQMVEKMVAPRASAKVGGMVANSAVELVVYLGH